MKKYTLRSVALLASLLAVFGVQAEYKSKDVQEVEAAIGHYFDVLMGANPVEEAEALTTKELNVLDIGAEFNYEEWGWYFRTPWEPEPNDERGWTYSRIITKNFRTKVVGDYAYTNFNQYWEANPYYLEASSMVLKRVEGKWLIDRFSIHDVQTWKKWLEERLWLTAGMVERNWYEIYVNEVYKERLRLAR